MPAGDRRMLPVAAVAGLLAFAGGFASIAGERPAVATDATGGDQTVAIVRVEPGLELRLADGRLLRLAGVDPAAATPGDPGLPERTGAALAAMVIGRPVKLHVSDAKPDRWGRLPALVAEPAKAEGDINVAAIRAGLGRYDPEPTARECRDALLAAETAARSAQLGLWGDPYYAVLALGDRAAVARHSATFVLAEGRLATVDADPYRTKLRFAPGTGRDALVATIAPRIIKAFDARGLHVRDLVGRTLRLRGLLDLRFGPELELANPDALEVLTADTAGHG